MESFNIPKLEVGKAVEELVDWLSANLGWLFDGISAAISGIVNLIVAVFGFIPPLILIVLVVAATWYFSKRNTAILVGLGLLLVWNMGFWEDTIITFALVFTATFVAILLGIPLGIWAARNDRVEGIMKPILDFMQTMPAFVYLIPAVFFFGTGSVPGVLASVVFAMPPTIRMTNLGIRQVPKDMIEAADAFGATSRQKLFGVQLPLARPSIMAGVNQSIMLSLSMVVIGAMIGATGLGASIYRSVTQIRVGLGFEAGLAVVVLAIVLDRITQGLGQAKRKKEKE